MPFVTGTAASMADVQLALRNACVANGWTLAGNVLYKGTCYVQHVLASTRLDQTGGTGIDGSNNLTGPGPRANAIGTGTIGGTGGVPTYPLNYYIFINTSPDEVYMFIEYSGQYYQWLAFGQSPVDGLTGTGNWYAAGSRNGGNNWNGISLTPTSGGRGGDWEGEGALFARTDGGPGNSFIHHNIDGHGWAQTNGVYAAIGKMAPLYTPNANLWNGEAILIPIHVYYPRPSGMNSLCGSMKHSRYIRIPNYNPKDVIILGPDKWMVFPWFTKNTSAPNGGSTVSHSGTMGIAIRYDGP